MSGALQTLAGTPVWVADPVGPKLGEGSEVSDLLSEAMSAGARLIALPVERLSDDFLVLRSGLAGEMLQKFVNYGFRAAIVGDVSQAVGRSEALRDFVRESNRGRHVWFVADLAALEAKLGA